MSQPVTDPADPATAADTRPADAKKGGGWRGVLLLVLAAWVLRCFIVAPFAIPSGSMQPTMQIGDHLLVAKWPYGYSRQSMLLGFPPFKGRVLARDPARGDIVVFRGPQGNDVVKRVIGLPGETITIRRGVPVINGVEVKRVPAGQFAMPVSPNSPCEAVNGAPEFAQTFSDGQLLCLMPRFTETLPGGPSYSVIDQGHVVRADDIETPTLVPAGHYFLMGDNRDNSGDSRFPVEEGGIGLVPQDNLIGRASIVYWSTDGSASWINPVSWFTAARWERFFRSYGSL